MFMPWWQSRQANRMVNRIAETEKKTVKVAEADFLDSLGEYSRKKIQTGLVELLRKGQAQFAKSLGNGKTLEFIVADANHALKKHSTASNVTVTVEDMIEALGGESAVSEIVEAGNRRRQAARMKRGRKKATSGTPATGPVQEKPITKKTSEDRAKLDEIPFRGTVRPTSIADGSSDLTALAAQPSIGKKAPLR